MLQTVAQKIFEPDAGLHDRGGFREKFTVALVAGQKPFLPVEKDKAIGQRVDCGPDAHLVSDINGKADKVAVARPAFLQLDPGAIAEL